MTEAKTVIFCTKTNHVVDTVPDGTEDDARSRLQELTPKYGPGLILLPPGEAFRRYEDGFKSGPEEITKERFFEMLEVLPPVAWHDTSDGESFKMSERTAGPVTSIFVRLGDRYFTFSDDIRTPHTECCRRVVEHIRSAPTP